MLMKILEAVKGDFGNVLFFKPPVNSPKPYIAVVPGRCSYDDAWVWTANTSVKEQKKYSVVQELKVSFVYDDKKRLSEDLHTFLQNLPKFRDGIYFKPKTAVFDLSDGVLGNHKAELEVLAEYGIYTGEVVPVIQDVRHNVVI